MTVYLVYIATLLFQLAVGYWLGCRRQQRRVVEPSPDKNGAVRITFMITPDTYKVIKRLQMRMEDEDVAKVLSRSLTVYEWVTAHADDGYDYVKMIAIERETIHYPIEDVLANHTLAPSGPG